MCLTAKINLKDHFLNSSFLNTHYGSMHRKHCMKLRPSKLCIGENTYWGFEIPKKRSKKPLICIMESNRMLFYCFPRSKQKDDELLFITSLEAREWHVDGCTPFPSWAVRGAEIVGQAQEQALYPMLSVRYALLEDRENKKEYWGLQIPQHSGILILAMENKFFYCF